MLLKLYAAFIFIFEMLKWIKIEFNICLLFVMFICHKCFELNVLLNHFKYRKKQNLKCNS